MIHSPGSVLCPRSMVDPATAVVYAAIWAKTSASKGGAKDPAAAVVSRAVHIAKKKAELSEGDERTALLNCDGFKAYAAEMIWVSSETHTGILQHVYCCLSHLHLAHLFWSLLFQVHLKPLS